MAFILFCGIIAFLIQIIVLHSCKHRWLILRALPLIVLELFPAIIAAHAFITRRPGGVLGWEFTIVVCEWIAGAILSGCVFAWVIWLFITSGKT